MKLQFLGLFVAASATEDELSLLQLPLRQSDPVDAASQEARRNASLPLAWIHIPKAGSSFGNFLVDLPGVCPGIPHEATVTDDITGPPGWTVFLKHFKRRWDVGNPDGACEANIYRFGNHDGVGNSQSWDLHYKHHAMIMLRDPEQRMISAYHYLFHSWPRLLPPANVRQYADVIQGCAVRMLTGPGHSPEETCGGRHRGLPTESDLQLAIARVRSDFAFVGITDQWALSMCLGHRMFGGRCHRTDFVDTRVTMQVTRNEDHEIEVRATPEPWNLTELHGFRDPYDGPLYAAGLEVFEDELKRYSTSLKSCQSCFKEAGIRVK